jgi:hypothetical protein
MGTASGLRILGRQEPWPASCAPDETSRSAPADSSSAANAGPTRGRPRSRAAREPGGRAACGRGVSAQAVWFHLATVMTPVAVKVPAAGSYCSAYSLASERHVRWCGRWGRVTAPGDPIHLPLPPRRRPGEGVIVQSRRGQAARARAAGWGCGRSDGTGSPRRDDSTACVT